MQTSLFLAKLIGPFLLAIGVGILANRVRYRAMAEELIRSHSLFYFAGLLAFVPGLAIILTHNVWTADWRVIITLIGWFGVLAGILHIVCPERFSRNGSAVMAKPSTLLIRGSAMLVIGAALSFFGYSA